MYSTRGNLYAFASIRDLTSRRREVVRSLIKLRFRFFFCWKWRFCFGTYCFLLRFLLIIPRLCSREDLLLVVLVEALLDLLHSV